MHMFSYMWKDMYTYPLTQTKWCRSRVITSEQQVVHKSQSMDYIFPSAIPFSLSHMDTSSLFLVCVYIVRSVPVGHHFLCLPYFFSLFICANKREVMKPLKNN